MDQSFSRTSRARASEFGFLIGMVVLVALPVALFYPGLMNNDSLLIYGNALDGGPASDWNSPFLVYLWRALLWLGLNAAAFTLLQSAIYALPLGWLLARAGLDPLPRLAVLSLILALPPTLTWLATLEKTTMTACLLCACFAVATALETARHGKWLFHVLLALALIGVFTRPNGILFFAPVVAYTAWRQSRVQGRWWTAAVVTAFLITAIGLPMMASSLGAVERHHPEQEFFALDLMNLSMAAGRDLLPEGALTVPLEAAVAVMLEQPFPPFGGRFSVMSLRLNGMLPYVSDDTAVRSLRLAWINALETSSWDYARYRLALFWEFNCFDFGTVCYDSWHWYTGGIDLPNRFGLESHAVPSVFKFYRGLAGSVFYRPYAHALATLTLLVLALRLRKPLVAAFAAILLVNYLSYLLILPGISARMAIPLGLMIPVLTIGLFIRADAVRGLVAMEPEVGLKDHDTA